MNPTFLLEDYTKSFRTNLESIKVPNPCNYLEIGIWEGRSAVHMLENYLTDENSRYTGIEKNPLGYMLDNLKPWKYKTTIIIGDSRYSDNRHALDKDSMYDMIYIDGCHDGDVVMHDSLYALCNIKKNGIVIWDDYAGEQFGVKSAVDDVLKILDIDYEVLFNNWQLGIRVT